jgi:cell division protein FtsQ
MKNVQENKTKSKQKIKGKKTIVRKNASFLSYKIKLFLTYTTIFCVISSLCILLSSAILFKIKDIVVQGDEVYEKQTLIEESGIKKGDNLFFTNTKSASINLEGKFPNIDTVTITKKFPNKLIIDIRKANKAFCIESEEQYVFISNKGKVLEISDERDENLILLKGISLDSFEVGKKVQYVDKSVEKKLSEFAEKMNSNGLSKISEINFNNGSLFFVNYDNRIKINFGFYENMDYKIKMASEIINNKLGAAESGTLDLSEVPKENRSYFTPNY